MINDLVRQVNKLQQQVDALVKPEVSSSGGGVAAGNDTEVQWNNVGAFGASPNFTFDDATNIVSMLGDGGSLIITQDAIAGALPSLTLRNDDVSEPLISVSSDAGDQDLLFTELTGITGTPSILWDESENEWLFTPGINATSIAAPGADTQIIFNNAGSLGANANFTWDDATGLMSVFGNGGRISIIQDDAAGAFPALTLRQDDVSTPLISIDSDLGDQDLFLIQLDGITGVPVLSWDESEDSFSLNKGLDILGSLDAITVTGANVTSGVNPGHTHTGASISGIDISDDTNLAVTAPIELVDDTLNLNASVADVLLYSTAADTWAETSVTAFIRTLLDDADAATARTTLGLVAGGTGDIWVEKAGDTMTGDLTFSGAFHPIIAPGSDTDAVLLEVTVTGTPQSSWDESEDCFNWNRGHITTEIGIGTAAAPSELLHVEGSSDPIIWLDDSGAATGAEISRTMPGIQLSAGITTAETGTYPAIKWMSTDPNFTTENPKLLAAIIGRATETYSADTDGGMILNFFTTANNPGATNVPGIIVQMRDNMVNIGNGSFGGAGTLTSRQASATGAVPVLSLTQDDISEEFIEFIGTAAVANLTQSIVAEASVTTATRQGFLKVLVQDDGNRITDQSYFLPIYTLA